jgi:drug/metabolite transporter (DMT)-like permease
MIFLAAFLYALQSLFTKKFAPDLDGISFAFFRTVFLCLYLGSALFFFERGISLPPVDILFLLFLAGFLGTFISRIFYFEAHNLLPISIVNIFVLLEPVFVLVGSLLFLNAPFSLQKGVGVILILSGLFLITKGHLRYSKKTIRKHKP